VLQQRGWRCAPATFTTSDRRFSGSVINTWNADVWSVDGATISLRSGTYQVTNDGGSWSCQYAGNLAHGSGLFFDPDIDESVMCHGEGGYEGLTAIMALDWSDFAKVTITGLIIPGDVPPVP
jgi:hypothetical protein